MGDINELKKPIERLTKLYAENARLSLTEKMTRVLSGAAIALICTLFLIICLAFISIGMVAELKTVMSPVASYFIVGGFYVILMALLIIFRRAWLMNPVSRFISKIMMTPPVESPQTTDNEQK